MIAITATRLYSPDEVIERPLVLIQDGRILEVTSRASQQLPGETRLVDFGDAILVPGFLDIHIHGGAGHDVMANDSKGLLAFETLITKHGIAGYLPTTVTSPLDQTLAALDRLADSIENRDKEGAAGRARPLGIHLEGPFISHVKRGVHSSEHLLPPSLATFERFWQAARGQIKVMTIAPELEGALEVIAEASRRGVCVSIGHSDADIKSALAGVAAGARHATHTFNAMRPLDHREPGIIGEVLVDARLSADIIADGVHIDPVVVRLFLNSKGSDGAVLITDATAATGMPEGHYQLGSLDVEVKDGKCTADGKLAGSVLTMDRAVRNVVKFADWKLQKAIRLATHNPARVLGLARRGKLEAGCDADLVVLNANGEVKHTIIAGTV